jgi:hypothetical protein
VKYVMFVVGDADHTAEDEAAAPDLEHWFAYVRACTSSTGASWHAK